MQTRICRRLGCDSPIFAFTHCRDVVVEVTKAGGFGVLGAVTFSPEQLEAELRWIDRHVGDRAYGVDVLIPGKYDTATEASNAEVLDLIPATHRAFVQKLLDEAGLPPLPAEDYARLREELRARERTATPSGAQQLLEVALQHSRETFEAINREVHAWPELMKAVKAGKINATSFGFTIPQELKSARAAAA